METRRRMPDILTGRKMGDASGKSRCFRRRRPKPPLSFWPPMPSSSCECAFERRREDEQGFPAVFRAAYAFLDARGIALEVAKIQEGTQAGCCDARQQFAAHPRGVLAAVGDEDVAGGISFRQAWELSSSLVDGDVAARGAARQCFQGFGRGIWGSGIMAKEWRRNFLGLCRLPHSFASMALARIFHNPFAGARRAPCSAGFQACCVADF